MAVNESHEVRELKWKVKQLGKQLGKQGEVIHGLRTEVAWLRSALTGPARETAEATFTDLERRVDRLKSDRDQALYLLQKERESAEESVLRV